MKMIRRSQLEDGPSDYADIKTLMSSIESSTSPTSRKARRDVGARRTYASPSGLHQPGLVALYAIDRIRQTTREPGLAEALDNAVDDVSVLAPVFPGTVKTKRP